MLFFHFLWNDKKDKIKRSIMINDYPEGGRKMIDISSFNKSLKTTWIKKCLDSGNHGKWKNFFNLALGTFGGSTFFELGNLNRKDIHNLKIEDTFVKGIAEIWSDTFFEGKIVSKDHFLSLPLLQNSLIRINNAPVFCNDWLTMGITQVKHLMDDNSLNLFSFDHFQNRYSIRVKPLINVFRNSLSREIFATTNPGNTPAVSKFF